MRLIKKTRVYLIILGVLVFAAGSIQAGGVIEEWVRRYNEYSHVCYMDMAYAIAVDGSGNIYVTGKSVGSYSYDYATIKYDSNGGEQWVRMYNGGGYDWARAIAVDGSGNIYVTGESCDHDAHEDYATIKYDSAGNEIWVRRYDGPGTGDYYWDIATAIALDGFGSIYVTGYSVDSGTGNDYATIKYDTNGNQLWVARYNGPGNGGDMAYAIAVDGSGNIYVTGQSSDSGTGNDYATIKYDSDGNELWVRRYNGPGNSSDGAYAIAVDGSSNIYVTGYSSGSGTSTDYATIKYDPDGNELWVRRYNGPGNSYDVAYAIAVDGSSNIYVTGYSYGSGTSTDYATIKYDPDGNELWIRRYNGPGNSYDVAYAIAVDSSGNVYVTGDSVGSGTGNDYATIKYDTNGNKIWVCRYNGPGNSSDEAHDIAVDGSSNIYVTGQSKGSGSCSPSEGWDYATIKYSHYDFVLTMEVNPPDVNTVTPEIGEHYYLSGTIVDISADRFVDCPDVYVFDYWEGDVNDPNSASTTVLMDTDKTVTAVFVDVRKCGDECHPYPQGDVNKDCRVNFFDIAVVANTWLECTDPNCD